MQCFENVHVSSDIFRQQWFDQTEGKYKFTKL